MPGVVSLQQSLGSYIRELRQRSGLNIDQLAEKSGMSSDRLNAIERGEVNLNVGTMLLLAMCLDTSLQDLFSGLARRLRSTSGPLRARIIQFPRSCNR
jgi:transcriptional regulator with XRE-family HTH domain